MYSILYITDSHLKVSNPVARLDNYFESLLLKHDEFARMCIKFDPDQVWHGGDFFDGPRQTMRMLLAVIEFINKSQNRHKSGYWHVLVGNHPWQGRWEDWKGSSALTVLERLGMIFTHEDCHMTRIGPKHLMRMEHIQLVEKPVPWEHVTFEEYAEDEERRYGANVILCSDYHPFQGHKIVNGVHFIAPGAISRGTRAESDINRIPRAALIRTDGEDLSVKFIPFKTAKPGIEVIDTSVDLSQETIDERKAEFCEAVELLKTLSDKLQFYNIEDVVEVVAQHTTAQRKVVERCLRHLSGLSSTN